MTEDQKPAGPLLGPKPRLEYHRPDVLVADPRYQRSLETAAGRRLIRQIAAEFWWPFFGVIVATDNCDGTFCVIDGQHRVEAAKHVDGVHSVPVMVVEEMSLKEQARTFMALNQRRVKLTPLQLHLAAVRAGDGAAKELDDLLSRCGAAIARGQSVRASDRDRGELTCVGALQKIHAAQGAEHLERVVRVVMTAFEGNPADLLAQIFKAVSVCLAAGADGDVLARRLGGKDAVTWVDGATAAARFSADSSVTILVRQLMS